MLFTPEELGWIKEFTAKLQDLAPKRQWTALLHTLVQMGVALPSACGCEQAWELETWLHKNHADFNSQIRAAIMATGAREGLYKALYRDVHGPSFSPELADCGRVAQRVYGELLLDFLRVKPTKEWFKPPVTAKADRMYQGKALDHQELNPGLTH